MRWPLIVIAFWIALATVPLLSFTPLAVAVGRHAPPTLPNNALVMVTSKQVAEAFQETGSDNLLLVVLTTENGLGPPDEATYGTLVDKLRQDTRNVKTVQDFLSTPPLRDVLESKDKRAWNLPINLVGDPASPEARSAYEHVADVTKQTVAGSTLTANLTGPAATFADLADNSERDMKLIEYGTAILVLVNVGVLPSAAGVDSGRLQEGGRRFRVTRRALGTSFCADSIKSVQHRSDGPGQRDHRCHSGGSTEYCARGREDIDGGSLGRAAGHS